MAGLKVFRAFRRLKRPFTRKSKFKKHNFLRGIPNHKIVRFDMGDKREDYPIVVKLVSTRDLNIRHNAIEAARIVIQRTLQEKIGKSGYKLKVNKYPHHGIRENKGAAGGNKADRVQSGMSHSYGKLVTIAVRLKKNEPLFSAYVEESHVEVAKKALASVSPKLPCGIKVLIEKRKL